MSPAKFRLGRQVIPVALGHYNDCNCNVTGHKEFCSEAVDERKMKGTGKERRQTGRDQLKESFVIFKNATKETEGGKEAIEVVKKMCKEMGKSKKGSESSSKAKAAAKK